MPIKTSTLPGGRPAESRILSTGKLAEKLTKDGQIQPLEVIYDNMRWYAQAAEMLQALALRERHELSIGRLSRGERRYHPELRLMQTVMHLRDRAQACAVDAMPYVHPKVKADPIEHAAERPFILQLASGLEKL